VSPDGQRVAFLEHPLQWDDRGWIAVVDRQGHKRRLTGEWVSLEGLAWAPGGKELWFSASKNGEPWFVQAVTLDRQQRQLSSDVSGLLLQDVSTGGQILVTRTFDFMQHFLRLPGASHEQSLALADQTTPICFSPDSKNLLLQYWAEGTGSNYIAGIVRVDGSSPVRLGEGRPLAMSPDGRWVAALLPATEQIELLPTGPGEPKRIQTGGQRCATVQFLPDGKRLVIQCWEKEGQARFYVQDIEGTNRYALSSALVSLSLNFLSPNGQHAFARDAQGVARLFPVAGGESKVLPGIENGDQIVGWSADSQSIFVHRNTPFPVQVDRLDLSTGRRTRWKEVAPGDLLGAYEHWILVAPDGETYNYSIARIFCRLYTADGIK
jgi:eukaryotic-like serine/threonine-protein kinase